MSRTSAWPPGPDGSASGDLAFCRAMLPLVSRTFAACIRLLPPVLSHQVLVSYLLCRIADTIEDTADLPLVDKQRLLAAFSRQLTMGSVEPALGRAFAAARTADELLAREADGVVRELVRLGEGPRQAIVPWVVEMCQGMSGVRRHPPPGPSRAPGRALERR